MHVDMDAFSRPSNNWIIQSIKATRNCGWSFFTWSSLLPAPIEARKFGVHSAMPISRAKKLCPDGILCVSAYGSLQRGIPSDFSIMKEFTPHIEPLIYR